MRTEDVIFFPFDPQVALQRTELCFSGDKCAPETEIHIFEQVNEVIQQSRIVLIFLQPFFAVCVGIDMIFFTIDFLYGAIGDRFVCYFHTIGKTRPIRKELLLELLFLLALSLSLSDKGKSFEL